MNIVILGLSITSSWGNGHATTYRGLVRELAANGHDVLFLERDVPWYAGNRDLPEPPYCATRLYRGLGQLKQRYTRHVREADLVIVGSYVPDGVAVGEWVTETAEGVTAFYDIDTPVTLAKLAKGDFEYLSPHLIPRYDLYLSFTGGPTLRRIEKKYGSPRARALYCSFDPEHYFPKRERIKWDLGYLGTYSDDRQPTVEALLNEPARRWPEGRFIVAGPQYPDDLSWPRNVKRVTHLPPRDHRRFYNAQRFTLNVTRVEMIRAGWSPSVRLFEAAACAVPIISDWWDGLDKLFEPDREILIARSSDDVLRYLHDIHEDDRREIGLRARQRALNGHTAAHRARELEGYVSEVRAKERRSA
ncbi:MAG TPA: glycosyltransferase [Thermoanaerobaculia bacterium]|jgi:spore maturation protein CgeB